MALMTGEQYIESIRKMNMEIYMFGEKIDHPADHPVLRPSLNSVRMTYDLAQDHGAVALYREKGKPFYAYPSEHGRPEKQSKNAASVRTEDRGMFSEMRRYGCV